MDQRGFKKLLPQRLLANYRAIMTGRLVTSKAVDAEGLELLRRYLNDSQAQNEEERLVQRTVRFLYRQNTGSFYKFLVNNKLACVVLWTEAKCIVRHMGLQGLVYIRWNDLAREMTPALDISSRGGVYDVFPHKNIVAREIACEMDEMGEQERGSGVCVTDMPGLLEPLPSSPNEDHPCVGRISDRVI